NVPLCVVLGHESCDVVTAAIGLVEEHGDHHLTPTMVQLLERIEPAVRKARRRDLEGKPLHDLSEEEHAHATVAECMRRSPLLRRFASVGKFKMLPARYHSDGEVEWLPVRPLPQPEHHRPATLGAVPTGLPPHVALRMLQAGHRRFLGDSRPQVDLTKERRQELAAGEQPLAIVVTDSDSRVAPELIFDAGLGELYVVRIAGNTLTDETLASIEFAAGRLGASLLVVMGHNRCEPIAAAADHPERRQLTPHQRKLLTRLEPAVQSAQREHATDVVEQAAQQNVVRTLHEARSRSALLRELEGEGRFAMLAAYYDVATGDLHWLKSGAATQPAAQVSAHAPESHGQEHGQEHEREHGDAVAHAGSHGHEEVHETTAHAGGGHGEEHGSGHESGHETTAGHDELPVVDLHAAPLGESSPAGNHDAHDGGHDAHDEHDKHDEHEAAGGHGEHAEPTDHEEPDTHDAHNATDELLARWLDPIVVVGMTGIASLLLAAVLALRNRG
ncbi:MAG TPA: hypothetical protein ENI87_11715, partial [bacterium]|nr:hypothetical protein [bacterium]